MRFAKIFITMLAMVAFILSTTATTTFAATDDDWETGLVTAKGYAQSQNNEKIKSSFYKTYIRQAAKLDALRKLAETIGGIYIDSSVTVEEGKIVRDYLKAYLDTEETVTFDGTRQIGESKFHDGICEVVMGIPRFGQKSAAASIFSHDKEPRVSFPKPKNFIKTEKYTGLIIDCRGLNLGRSITVNIKNKDDLSIYKMENLNYGQIYSKLINQGMVSYSRDIDNQIRAGKNPLVIKAIDLGGYNKENPIVSIEDSDKILSANQLSGFLDAASIVFVY